MNPSLPISRIVNVQVQMTPLAAQGQSLSNLLFLGTSDVIDPTERYRNYGDLTAVAADFGSQAEEYYAARAWFSQQPQPTNLSIGRFVKAAASGGLRCGTLSAAQQVLSAWTGITTGAFSVAKDGASAVNVTGLNFSGATTMAGIAAIIQGAPALPAGVAVTWNSVYRRFEFKSATTGAASAVSFLGVPGSGVDISANLKGGADDGGYVYQGAAAETAAACAALFDNLIGQQFYGLAVGGLSPGANAGADTAALLEVAAFVEATNNKHLLVITTQEPGSLSPVSTTDILYQLQQLGYKRSFPQFSSSNAYAAITSIARILTVNYEGSGTAITLKFKQDPGVIPETLTATQADALEAKNGNVFLTYNNGASILEQGVMASGDFVDSITGTDWLAVTLQRDLFNALYSNNTKIPQTDAGQQVLTTICNARCAQAVTNGLVAPGVWNSGGFGVLKQGDYMEAGYYVYSAAFATQSQADRAARKAMPIQIAVKLAGAIHSVDVLINVNQ